MPATQLQGYASMRFLDVAEITATKEDTIEWARSVSLLHSNLQCQRCNQSMSTVSTNEAPDFQAFRCTRCTRRRSIRTSSITYNSNIPLRKIILMLYMWSINTSNQIIQNELDLTDKTVTSWCKKIRLICKYAMENIYKNEMIGGPGTIVEVDESLVARRKYNRGRATSQKWVFGGIQRQVDGTCNAFVEFVQDRRETTLLAIIQKRILCGTTIISDGWAAYRNLSKHGYFHHVINHSQNFVDPINPSIHTQRIENHWKHLKAWLKNKGSNLGAQLDEYLIEYIYKKKHTQVFDAIVMHITTKYKQ
jgi:transposase-like protein